MELLKMQQNPKEWKMPTGNYANHCYSKLNVGKAVGRLDLLDRRAVVGRIRPAKR